MGKEVIGEKIKRFRMMKSYSQNQLAKAIGINQPGLAAYEKGERIPKIDKTSAIAKELNVDPVELADINLTEDDEIRLLNKLLAKHCTSIQKDDKGSVIVELPENFMPLQEKYDEYLEHLEDARWGSEDLDSPLSIQMQQSAKDELDFWLETWPEYDYLYQAKKQGISNVDERGYYSIKQSLNQKCAVRFFGFEDNYLRIVRNENK